MVSASKMPKQFYVSFSLSVLILSWLGSSIPSVICRLPFFMTSIAHFSMPNSIPTPWLYILTACNCAYSYFSFCVNSLMSSMYIKWLIFSCDLQSLYPAVPFLGMWLSGIMAIMNSNGDRASPWNIPLWIFLSAKLLPPAVNYTVQIFMVFSIKFMTSCDFFYVLKHFIIQLGGTISYTFLLSLQTIAKFFSLVLLSFRMC